MNRQQHYKRAEDLEQLAVRQFEGADPTEPTPIWTLTMAQAQMHATLASVTREAVPPEEGSEVRPPTAMELVARSEAKP